MNQELNQEQENEIFAKCKDCGVGDMDSELLHCYNCDGLLCDDCPIESSVSGEPVCKNCNKIELEIIK